MLIAGGEAICRGADGWTHVLRAAELQGSAVLFLEDCGQLRVFEDLDRRYR